MLVIHHACAAAFGAVPFGVALASAGQACHVAFGAAAGAGNLSCPVTLVAFYLSFGVAFGAFALADVSGSGATVATETAASLTVGATNLFLAVAQLTFAVAVVAEITWVGDTPGAFATRTFLVAKCCLCVFCIFGVSAVGGLFRNGERSQSYDGK